MARSQSDTNSSCELAICTDMTELRRHVFNSGRNYRGPCCHVFQRLCRIDELGSLIKGERHEADVKTLGISGKLLITAASKPEKVCAARQFVWVYFYMRTHQHYVPVRMAGNESTDQFVIQTFINNAKVAQNRSCHALKIARNSRSR